MMDINQSIYSINVFIYADIVAQITFKAKRIYCLVQMVRSSGLPSQKVKLHVLLTSTDLSWSNLLDAEPYC